jgi:hypothetical protein
MKESCRKGVANHPGPESCVGPRKGLGEALTGVHAGGALSREITHIQVPTLFPDEEGHIGSSAIASPTRTWRGRSTLACVETPCTRPERSRGYPETMASWVAWEKPEATSLR